LTGIVLTNSFRHPTSALAAAEGTDTSFDWGYVRIYRRPKKVKGLHETDVSIAANIDWLVSA